MLVAVLSLIGCGGPSPDSRLSLTARGPAIDLTLPLLAKEGAPRGQLVLSSLRGAPLVLTVFASWDLRSQAEVSLMEQLHQRRRGKVSVVGVALGRLGSKGLPIIRTFVEVMGATYPVMLADPGDLSLAQALGRIRQVPRTLLLDARGRVLLDMVGQTDFPRLLRALDMLTR